VRLDSSALASACAPASPIWFTAIALTQHDVTITTTAPQAHTSPHIDNHNCSGSRTAQIQRRQSAIGLERPGQCLSTRIANPVAWDRTHSARHHNNHNRSTSTHHRTLTPTSAVGHAPRRFSVVRVVLDSSALASA
jgi:hypothetical protein